jgi:hypothetical protein
MPHIPTFKHWPADLIARSTPELIRLYERGFQGAIKDPAQEEAAYDAMDYKRFEAAAHANNMTEDGAGKLSLCFSLVRRLNPKEYPGPAQRTGCCVSRSTVNAFTASYAYEVWNAIPDAQKGRAAAGVVERWPQTKNPADQTFDHVCIYGERGWRGQGANCGTLAIAARDKTGLLPRGTYDIPGYGTYDCSTYDDRQAARSGPNWPESFRKFVNEHRVRDVTSVQTIEEARDALANHYGLSVCSSYACSSQRPSITDSKGNVCAGANSWSGSWAHAMAWLGCDDRPWAHKEYGGPIFLVCNSWGKWNSGPVRVYDTDIEIPPGFFWIRPRDASTMLRGGGAYVLSSIKGFPRQPLTVSWW